MSDVSNERAEVATTALPAQASAGLSAESEALHDAYPRDSVDPGLSVGARLGERYEIIGRLGQGGMGVVYAARNTNVEHIRYAIKTLLPGGPQADAHHFLQEARRASKIRSPHVVQILDFGTDAATGLIYMVMEHLGEDLEKYATRHGGTLPPELAIDFCAQVCEGIATAHEGGVVHRDIKPLNCLLRVDGPHETVVVTDFGIAREIHGARRAQDGASAPNSVWTAVGTPGYVAPEIWLRESKADHRVDVYGVGAMLFKLLTGRPPPLVPRLDELRQAGVPETIVPVLSSALARDPTDRFPSMRALRAALLALQPASVAPIAPIAPIAPAPTSPKPPIGLMVSAAVLGVAAFALLATQMWHTEESPPPIVQTVTPPPPTPEPRELAKQPDEATEPESATLPPTEPETKQPDSINKDDGTKRPNTTKKALKAFADLKALLTTHIARFCNAQDGAQACKKQLKKKRDAFDTKLQFDLAAGSSRVTVGSPDGRLADEKDFKSCVKTRLTLSKWRPPLTRDGGTVTCPISL